MNQRSLNVKNLLKPDKFKLGSFWIGPILFFFLLFLRGNDSCFNLRESCCTIEKRKEGHFSN